jgi:hypothetical protein
MRVSAGPMAELGGLPSTIRGRWDDRRGPARETKRSPELWAAISVGDLAVAYSRQEGARYP